MSTTPKNPWEAIAQPMQTMWANAMHQMGQPMPFGMPGAMPMTDMMGTFAKMVPSVPGAPQVSFDPTKLQALQQAYMKDLTELWMQGMVPPSIATDRRFASEEWQKQPVSGFAAALHLINTRMLMGLADAMQGDAKTKARVLFAVEQWAAAAAPSNFLVFNADAQKKAIETKGESIAKGMQNMLHDMRQGHVSMTDESKFEVGRNVATTEGAVVFENELFQLIEYKPLTEKVHERPFLFIPPCINKFYILDLQPDNSVVRYLIEQGHHAFMLSWRNPDASMAQTTWDDYIEKGAITAIKTVQDLTRKPDINALGFCVGGTILSNALAVLAARGEKPVHSATFLTALLDFTHTGVLDLFIDEGFVRMRELQFGQGGLMPASDLSTTFSFLRPNDLVWNYVVGNYLKGETPPPFDLLYWNSDSTNLPGPMYAWYLRNTYLENKLITPGAVEVCGEKIDFNKVDIPVYIYGSREDHIVPIEGAYASTQVLPGEKRFVMGASGHIAGVINPVKKNKRSYWTNDELPASHEDWLAGATEHPGSWWADWSGWLEQQGGKLVLAPKRYGSTKYKEIEPAPGRYVKAKASLM
ncbi:class I poly(R)-hydroxyalkanoic acid synthase [Brachymonas denitrificans]|uniref:class I poly(R)-hydroxyalkanoic acid synthase n=1 Tax=Brachymonas denitrificans TaxID=28220 RepID=UPI00352D466F